MQKGARSLETWIRFVFQTEISGNYIVKPIERLNGWLKMLNLMPNISKYWALNLTFLAIRSAFQLVLQYNCPIFRFEKQI